MLRLRHGKEGEGGCGNGMTREFFECEQRSEEWRRLHMGIPTASDFDKMMAGGDGKTRTKYLWQLWGERVFDVPRREYSNADMQRGAEQEPLLRLEYAMMTDTEPKQIGFVRMQHGVGHVGCSPDGLVGDDGLLEIKSASPEVLGPILQSGRLPAEHLTQVQGQLWITERKWCDVFIGFIGPRDTKHFRKRVMRDTAHIARIAIAAEVFNIELDQMVRSL